MGSKKSLLFLAVAALVLSGNPAWSQSQSGTARGQEDNSIGGSQNQRSSDSQAPLPPRPGNVGKSSQPRSSTAQRGKDTSVGGTQSERTGSDSETPLPSVAQPGTDDSMKVDRNRRASGHRNMGRTQDVREAQEALKDQGHDPGPIDGIMGSQTRQALREFQSQNGLKQTGTLDAQTKEKLNIDSSSSSSLPSSSSRHDAMKQRESR